MAVAPDISSCVRQGLPGSASGRVGGSQGSGVPTSFCSVLTTGCVQGESLSPCLRDASEAWSVSGGPRGAPRRQAGRGGTGRGAAPTPLSLRTDSAWREPAHRPGL